MEFGLKDKVLEKITAVFESVSGIEEAIIYGSRALGNFREGSDIDMTLKGEITFNELIQIEKELGEKMLPYTFDISVYHRLSNQDLIAHIDRVGKQLYRKKKNESS